MLLYFNKLWLCISFVLFFSCSSKNTQPTNQKEPIIDSFPKGKVISAVTCKKDINQSYALFLPTNYSVSKKYPVLICFDAHARGKKAVTLFKNVANQFGYIVIGSNNSKNGVDNLNQIVSILFDDVFARFSIDNNRIYLAGFSGGARVAQSIAMSGGINGVISCAAGIAGINSEIKANFDYIGIIGDEDFNFQESVETEEKLDSTKRMHQLIIFNGKHDWPSEHELNEAITAFEISAMNYKIIPKNNSIIQNYIQFILKKNIDLQKQNRNFELYINYKKLTSWLQSLSDNKQFIENLNVLKKTGIDIQQKKYDEKEMQLREKYMKAFSSQNMNWWQTEINSIMQISDNSQNYSEKTLYRRLSSFLSMACYINTNHAINSKNFEHAHHLCRIYAMVDAKNQDMFYFSAIVEIANQNTEKAIELLKKAADYGFSDTERIKNNDFLAILQNNPQFYEIIEKIKQNKNQ